MVTAVCVITCAFISAHVSVLLSIDSTCTSLHRRSKRPPSLNWLNVSTGMSLTQPLYHPLPCHVHRPLESQIASKGGGCACVQQHNSHDNPRVTKTRPAIAKIALFHQRIWVEFRARFYCFKIKKKHFFLFSLFRPYMLCLNILLLHTYRTKFMIF